jgi:hypothetical protein
MKLVVCSRTKRGISERKINLKQMVKTKMPEAYVQG